MLAQVAALILALAKALPAIERLVALVEERRREARAAELHHAIDDAIAKARAATPVCPRADCPVFRRGVLHAAAPGPERGGAAPRAS